MTSVEGDPAPAPSVLPSHLFVELTGLDELSFPTTSSSRIRVGYLMYQFIARVLKLSGSKRLKTIVGSINPYVLFS